MTRLQAPPKVQLFGTRHGRPVRPGQIIFPSDEREAQHLRSLGFTDVPEEPTAEEAPAAMRTETAPERDPDLVRPAGTPEPARERASRRGPRGPQGRRVVETQPPAPVSDVQPEASADVLVPPPTEAGIPESDHELPQV